MKHGNYREIFEKEKKVVYTFTMNDELLQILLRVNADITLSDELKINLTHRLEHCASEEEFLILKSSLESYWESVDPIIQAALARKTPEEILQIEQSLAQMVSGTQKVVEKSVRDKESQESESILSSL
jgi:D-hexose-6-phosphate mutarotase